MKTNITVIGDLIVDIYLDLPEMPKPEATIIPRKIEMHVGGNGNFIVVASRLGLSVKVVDCIGNDSYGEYIRKVLLSEGVDMHNLIIRDGETRVCLVLIHNGLKSFIALFSRNTVVLEPDIIEEDMIEGEAIYISGYTLANVLGRQEDCAVYKAVEIAHKKGMNILFDASPLVSYIQHDLLLKVLKLTNILFLNVDELRKMTGVNSIYSALEKLKNKVGGIIVVKRGDKGAIVYDNGIVIRAKAIKCHTVDPTGAGDAFNAAFTYGYLKGVSLRETLKLANIVGGLATEKFGGGENLPSKQEIINFLKQYDQKLLATLTLLSKDLLDL